MQKGHQALVSRYISTGLAVSLSRAVGTHPPGLVRGSESGGRTVKSPNSTWGSARASHDAGAAAAAAAIAHAEEGGGGAAAGEGATRRRAAVERTSGRRDVLRGSGHRQCPGEGGGDGTQKCVYQRWPHPIFPTVNCVSHDGPFGSGGGV